MDLLHCGHNGRLDESAVDSLSEMLQRNTALNRVSVPIDYKSLIILAEKALSSNHSLATLNVSKEFPNAHWSEVIDAFTKLLKDHNFILQELKMVWRSWSDTTLQFYLKLNKAGRHRLLVGKKPNAGHEQQQPTETLSATDKDWINVIIQHKDDVDVVHYFLLKNPNVLLLWQHHPPATSTAATTTGRPTNHHKIKRQKLGPS